MKLDLETRENLLLNDQDNFYQVKKSFLDKILQSGQYENMTPEIRKLAKDMGVDVDEMAEESKRLKDIKNQLEKLKKK